MPAPDYGFDPEYEVVVTAGDILQNEMNDVELERLFKGLALGSFAVAAAGLAISQSYEGVPLLIPQSTEDIGMAIAALGLIGGVSASLYKPLSRIQDRILFWSEQRRTATERSVD
jgi:hypothetical protein